MPVRSLSLPAALVIGALVFAGCGDDDAAAPIATTSTTEATTDAPAAAGDIEIKDFQFGPAELTVAAGATVTIANADDAPHTFTSAGNFDTGTIASGDEATIEAPDAGTYDFKCTIHPQMEGTLVVE